MCKLKQINTFCFAFKMRGMHCAIAVLKAIYQLISCKQAIKALCALLHLG